MPNPVTIDCPAGVWTLIAEDQIFGYIYSMNKTPAMYLYTYRLTGEVAPTDSAEGTPVFIKDEKKFIISGLGIDIYIMAVGSDGAVRYDWWW